MLRETDKPNPINLDVAYGDTKLAVNLRVQDVDFAAFFRGSRFFDTTEGKLQGRIQLAGIAVRSLRSWARPTEMPYWRWLADQSVG
jgi:hypothetical protein